MNSTKLLPLLAFLAVLTLLAVQEARFRRTVGQLRAEYAASPGSTDDAGAPSGDGSEEAREAVRQLSQARAELANAQHRLAAATGQIQQLRSQVQGIASTAQHTRGPGRGFSAADDPGFNPTIDRAQPPRRAWGEEQATGAPDTFQAGDIPTAWAPRQQDGGEEWLHLDYSNQVQLAEVRVRETHNPGAISKIAAVLPNGQEITIWEGVGEAGLAPVEKVFPVNDAISTSSVRVYLDTRRVPGWNEIDAVEVVGSDGSHQWAAHARASSSYANPR